MSDFGVCKSRRADLMDLKVVTERVEGGNGQPSSLAH